MARIGTRYERNRTGMERMEGIAAPLVAAAPAFGNSPASSAMLNDVAKDVAHD